MISNSYDMKKKISRTRRIIDAISSRYFFIGVIVLFVIEALWVALSGLYPMAFDENFHLGIIKLYADHLSPFWSAHPPGADAYGAITRDPSYLFHYLMAFPYMLIGALTNSQTIQVLILRFMNIGFFATGLVLWRKVLLETGASKALVHICLLLLVLVPVVPLLAAQLNYDNLLMLVVPVVLMLAIRVINELSRYKRVNTKLLLLLAATCMAASIIKYAFLPIMIAVVAFLVWQMWRSKEGAKKLWQSFCFGWTAIPRSAQILLIVFVAITGVLFAERYLLNVAKYHKPVVDCSQVLSVDQCKKYGPWARNYRIMNDPTINNSSVKTYATDWLHGMWLRSFFAVDGPTTGFQSRAPLFVPGAAALLFAALSVVMIGVTGRNVWRRYNSQVLWFLLLVAVTYIAVLWLNGFQEFLKLGQSVAINGRYLVLVAPIVFIVSGLALNELLRNYRGAKIVAATVIVVSFAWGGGALTYVLRSNSAWYWPNSTINNVNSAVQNTLGPITPGYNNPTKPLWRN